MLEQYLQVVLELFLFNDMRIEAEISKNMLYTSNNDKPGFIGALALY